MLVATQGRRGTEASYRLSFLMHQGWHFFYTYPQGQDEYSLAMLLRCVQQVSDLLGNEDVFPPTHLPAQLGKSRSAARTKHSSTEQVCTATSKKCGYLLEIIQETQGRTEISQVPYLKCSCGISPTLSMSDK